ncbi:uncharacterized protein FFNC_15613 [Fusarium fujikuroi]|nr:uncharacterized protein FFNC_15613 [Fusarium fujikuroi]
MDRLDSEEAWQLVKETFNAVRQSMPLLTPNIEFWTEAMILGYEARGEHEEAWMLTEQMFAAVLEIHGELTAPTVGPWIERLILGHETRGQHEEARQLTQQVYDAYTNHSLSFVDIGGMGVLFRLLCVYQSSKWLAIDQPLLSIVSRQQRLDLLTSDKLSPSCRSLLSHSLHSDETGYTLIRLRLGPSGGELRVHSDVLCYWSNYFARTLSGCWQFPDSFDVNPENEFDLLSLAKIFDDFIYSGAYKSGSKKERMKEKRIAEYFEIDYLIGILQ